MVADKKKYSTNFLSKKKVKKSLDISPKISDNITNDEVIDIATSEEPEEIDDNIGVVLDDAEIDEEVEEIITPEEVQRKINTEVFKRDGWLDDVDTNIK